METYVDSYRLRQRYMETDINGDGTQNNDEDRHEMEGRRQKGLGRQRGERRVS